MGKVQGFEHGAWSMEHREKPQIRNPQFEIKLLAPYVCLVPAALTA
jgi:hypothetical protein